MLEHILFWHSFCQSGECLKQGEIITPHVLVSKPAWKMNKVFTLQPREMNNFEGKYWNDFSHMHMYNTKNDSRTHREKEEITQLKIARYSLDLRRCKRQVHLHELLKKGKNYLREFTKRLK